MLRHLCNREKKSTGRIRTRTYYMPFVLFCVCFVSFIPLFLLVFCQLQNHWDIYRIRSQISPLTFQFACNAPSLLCKGLFQSPCFHSAAPPYLCFQLHLSVSLLLSLHRSLLIRGSDFLLLVTLLLSPTHSQSIRAVSWFRDSSGLLYLRPSFRNTIKILFFLFFFFKCSFLKAFFSFIILFYLLGVEE